MRDAARAATIRRSIIGREVLAVGYSSSSGRRWLHFGFRWEASIEGD